MEEPGDVREQGAGGVQGVRHGRRPDRPADGCGRGRTAGGAAGRNVDRLVVDNEEALEAAAAASFKRRDDRGLPLARLCQRGRHSRTENEITPPVVAWIDPVTGVTNPTMLVFQGIFGLGAPYATVKLVVVLVKLHKDVEMRGSMVQRKS